jgi:colanic acid biosynthesis glycosyl transferase WcaI
VPYGDADAVADALRRLADDPSEHTRLAARARQRVRDEFSAERMVERTREVYDGVLGVP